MSEDQHRILKVLDGAECRGFPLTTREIAERAGLDVGKVTRQLRKFQAWEWARPLGVGQSGGRTWEIAAEGERELTTIREELA